MLEKSIEDSRREKAFESFLNPDSILIQAIKQLREVKSKGPSLNCGPCKCYPCGERYFGNTSTEICPSCETLLNSRFSHISY